ncbi:tryptophanyl-tRNA synthetase [Melanomma pulvis-pyrius CBS 109.77]|uniref:Tryptophan--tRNA ligase, cytoplasmic n=1 Tax=Melanomma pulvis-pyrius CBS 109.77 TaxID=1314802 RepID=A0A6A6X1L3_9PLEO|nr:tryptophanyl-tRNA synthetase [Melanomma pulvis-pyrius CBS 109.77]
MEAPVITMDALETSITTPSADIAEDFGQDINPWSVTGATVDGKLQAINYDHLVETFGTRLITDDLLQRFKHVTGHEPHVFMRRGLVFSHRDLEIILDRHEKGQPFYLYTGRGPSSDSMHLGHMIPFTFAKWLQDVFDVPLVIMMTDDEKFLFGKKAYTMAEMHTFVRRNARDILAVGFDPKKTFLFSDFEFMGGAFYRNVVKVSRCITLNTSKAVFGFNDSDSVGKAHFVSIQTSASFATTFPHIFGTNTEETSKIPSLIPCAIDQDPYFRVCRDVAPRLGYAKPSLLHSKFFPALQGPGSKMSASIDSSAIFMSDTQKQIEKKINKYAFSGGRETAEEQRRFGGNPDVDVAYQYLSFFIDDDDELKRIEEAYRNGEMLTGELKKKCILELQGLIGAFQARRALIDDAVLNEFMAVRPLVWGTKREDPNGLC